MAQLDIQSADFSADYTDSRGRWMAQLCAMKKGAIIFAPLCWVNRWGSIVLSCQVVVPLEGGAAL